MFDNDMRESRAVVAGPVTALFADGDLRAICRDGREIVNRVYFALRDHNWGTVPGTISHLKVEQGEDRFLITYRSEHRDGEIHFVRDTVISGEPVGTVRYAFEGEALSTFRRNRIGLCVLHPMSAAGNRVIVTHPDGSTTDGAFPDLISPDQPFREIAAIRHYLPDGGVVETRFDGEIFETEDQRNWTDATFKTYCTPLRLAFPVEVRAGERIRQSVIISPESRVQTAGGGGGEGVGARKTGRDAWSTLQSATVVLGSPAGKKLIPLGLTYNRDGAEPTGEECARLAALRLSHLHLELVLRDDRCGEGLAAASECGRRIGARLRVALRLGTDARPELDRFLRAVDRVRPQVDSWTVLSEGRPTTSAEHLALVRERLSQLGRHELIGGGTRAFFAELNRNHPPVELLDFVTYTANPQVHAADELSIVETLGGQRATVESARAIARGKPVHVGPVTLRMQWNPNATVPPAPAAKGELPSEVDVRQRLPFAAAWTLGSVKALSEAGAERATFYDMVGWKGVMERAEGSPLPSLFPSSPGELFPLYHLFAALGEVAGGELAMVTSSDPLSFDALAVRKDALLRLFVANYAVAERRLRVEGISGAFELRPLGPRGSKTAAVGRLPASGTDAELVLGPHEVVWLDVRT